MTVSLEIGPEIINSYKRLSYTPWNAIAEFVDNSTQSYKNNREALDRVFGETGEILTVSIIYRKDFLSITDNSIGMSSAELVEALRIGVPTRQSIGRSKYGMGLKTAACWVGDFWTIRTKKLDEPNEYSVVVNVEDVAAGNFNLPTGTVTNLPLEQHYTVVEITKHNRKFIGRALNQIKQGLGSIYREDFRDNILKLTWNGEELGWTEMDNRLLPDAAGNKYKKEFEFDVNGKKIRGWVGVLQNGSRRDAGFTVLQAGRVIQGYPEAWRPESLYGVQGSNDLANQRLLGEIHVDGFDVSHTKDSLLWEGELEELIEAKLADECGYYREIALSYRKRGNDQRGPTEAQKDVAINVLNKELQSSALVDAIGIGLPLPEELIRQQVKRIIESFRTDDSTIEVTVGDYKVRVYIVERSPFDPYLVVDSAIASEVGILINTGHPHWLQINGTVGVINYLRHCIYDGIAEWLALHQKQSVQPETIKTYKNQLLWIPVNMEKQEMDGIVQDEAEESQN